MAYNTGVAHGVQLDNDVTSSKSEGLRVAQET